MLSIAWFFWQLFVQPLDLGDQLIDANLLVVNDLKQNLRVHMNYQVASAERFHVFVAVQT